MIFISSRDFESYEVVEGSEEVKREDFVGFVDFIDSSDIFDSDFFLGEFGKEELGEKSENIVIEIEINFIVEF